MSDSKKRLVDFEKPKERPSVKFIRETIEEIINGNTPSTTPRRAAPDRGKGR
ncbi:hypothetical protein [Roseovarius gaetbuli]|uniref:hypothetical protein n=1 Tax=Roseovarius gaetbuli TaxID=1356575 RepID=UPI001482AFBF|nr:hypothetical protein [Roseovarius gaetbuli]